MPLFNNEFASILINDSIFIFFLIFRLYCHLNFFFNFQTVWPIVMNFWISFANTHGYLIRENQKVTNPHKLYNFSDLVHFKLKIP